VVLLVGIAVAALGLGVASTNSVAAATTPTWQTTFRDNFDGTGLPNSKDWQLTLGTAYPGGPAAFGTGEIETLTNDPKNVDMHNGNLAITPQRDQAGAWTSARVESTRADFKPAAGGIMHVESRVQMPNVTGPEALGYWPAFWMLGGPYRQDRWSWPAIGEFDIMENVQGLNWSYGVLHCGTWGGPCNEPEGLNNGGAPCQATTCQAGFHVYSLEWDRSGPSDQLRWYIDGTLTHKVDESQVPAATWSSLADHAGYFIIMNVAIGGAFPNKLGGGPSASTKPGVPMLIDYVEVRYLGGPGTSTPPATPTPTGPATPTPTGTATATVSPTPTPTVTPIPTGTGTPGPTVTPTPIVPSAPASPSKLKVTGSTPNTITIGWSGKAGTSYDILRSGIKIATVNSLTFTDIGLQPSTPYLYSIRGNGVTTPVLTATAGGVPVAPTQTLPPTPTVGHVDPPAPGGAPGGLHVTASTPSTITIGWSGTAGTSYDVLRSGIKIATVTALTFTDIGLQPNTPYLYSIRGGGVTTAVLTAGIS
jgi:hypothetical protein